ncbi:MAG: hypothetical protein ABI068_04300 [Ktedonobacterales bacterium]
MRMAVWEARKWRDTLWTNILDALRERNPDAAAHAWAAIHSEQVVMLHGASIRAAALAWPHLDHQARADWLWACQLVQQTWISGNLPSA